jgi:exonuclease SbcC
MTGFACFREPTTISFADVEYFAIVGPTGSGKSTIIDAMLFALYGSVPRWEDRRTVHLALAPTVNRGTVRLVFDVGAERYVIARELRRTKNGANVRNVRLERLNNPAGLGAEDESTEMLASDSAATKRVEQILGLTFENFCTCVVLPQGDFADFLHAKPSDRQKILTNLLGLGVYEEIAKQAGKQASEQAQRAEFLAEQLEGFADTTTHAATLAAERVDALTVLSERVHTAVGQLRTASTAISEVDATVARITDERSQLSALAVPDGLAELDTRLNTARATLTSAQARLSDAETADTAARQRRAAAPARGPLEQVRRDHADLIKTRAAEPTAQQHHERAIAALGAATEIAKQARNGADLARGARETAADALTDTRALVDRLSSERDRLTHLAAPKGLDLLDSALGTAQLDLDTAQQELQRAETAELTARHALAAAAERGPLEQARRDHAALAQALTKQPEIQEKCTTAARQLATANTDVVQAQHRVEQARADREAAGRTDMVAELRPHLLIGQPCPVCEQTVPELPDHLPGTNLAQADAAVTAAEQDLTTMRQAQTNATRLEQHASFLRNALTAEIEQLRHTLDGAPATIDATDAQLAALDQLTDAARQADQRVRAARVTRDTASKALTAVRAQLTAANQDLHTARDPLVSLGAPEVGDHAPTGWATLTSWADQQRTLRDEQLLTACSDLTAAQQADTAAAAALQLATQRDDSARGAETAAARAEQQAQAELSALITRIEALQTVLSGAPSDTAATIRLAQLDELDAECHAAGQELLQARAVHDAARNAATAVQHLVSEEWTLLRNARDPLVPLGAPPLPDDDLRRAWTTLTVWADEENTRRDAQILDARVAATEARQQYARLQRSLVDDLQSHDIPVAGDESLVTDAATAVVTALERARAEQTRILADRAQAESLSPSAPPHRALTRSRGCSRNYCAPTSSRAGWSPRRWTPSSPTPPSASSNCPAGSSN